MNRQRLQEIKDTVEKAKQEVFALCRGDREWTMCIPAEPDRDSDCLIYHGLRRADDLMTEVETLRHALGECLIPIAALLIVESNTERRNLSFTTTDALQKAHDLAMAALQEVE